MEFTLKTFSPRTNPDLFHRLLGLHYSVFVQEQGQKLESNHRRKKVEVVLTDIYSLFVVVLDDQGRIVGGVKATLPSAHIPSKEMFAHHLGFADMAPYRHYVSVLSGLVLDGFVRGTRIVHQGREKSLAKALVDEMVEQLSKRDTKVIFASAYVQEAVGVLSKSDFYVIDEPLKTESKKGAFNTFINMAWAEKESLKKYFKAREKVILAGDGIKHLIRSRIPCASDFTKNKSRASAG